MAAMCDTDDNVQVVVRLRPPHGGREPSGGHVGGPCIAIQGRSTITVQLPHEDVSNTFHYDHAFPCDASQTTIFNALGPGIVSSCINGYNSSTFAYGQTGSGKTYTMLGDMCATSHHRGFVPRLFQLLFRCIAEIEAAQKRDAVRFSVRCSFLEIYNEAVTDLLSPLPCADGGGTPRAGGLKIRQSDKHGTFVEGAAEESVLNVEEVLSLLRRGMEQRRMGATLMNRESSRSHGVLTCTVERHTKTSDGLTHILSSRLNLIDLAGSEQLGRSKSQGERMKETRHINQSLSTLGRVIKELVEQQRSGKPSHVPYRDSKLTFLLQDSLGGNAKTTIIANVSPSAANINDTLGTLRFAQDARSLRNRPQQNRKTTGRLSALQAEIERLKQELATAHAHNEELYAEVEAQQHLRQTQRVLCGTVGELQERLEACLRSASQDAVLSATCIKEVGHANAEVAQAKAALAASQQAEQRKEQELQQQRAVAEELRVQLAAANCDIQAAVEKLQQQQAHAADLEQQLAAARASAREAAGQQQVLAQQLLAAREASRADTQGKQTLAIQLKATEARLAHQTHELHSVKQQLFSVEECAEAAAKLARQRAEALQTLKQHQQQEQRPEAASGACTATGECRAEVRALRVQISELQALVAKEKRVQAAEAAQAATRDAELRGALDAACTARDEARKLLQLEEARSKAITSQLLAKVQEAQKRAAAAEEQRRQKTQQHMLTAATNVVGNLEQLEKAARARAEAAEARAHTAETAARLAVAANSKLEAALAAARKAGMGVEEAEARAAAFAGAAAAAEARARAAEAATGSAEERAAAAEAAAKQLEEQLRAADIHVRAAEEAHAHDGVAPAAAAAARQKPADVRPHANVVESERQVLRQASEESEDVTPLGSSVASPMAADLLKVAQTRTAPADLCNLRVDQQRGLLHELEQDGRSDDSGDSTPRRHFKPQHTVETICGAYKLMGELPFLPLSVALSQTGDNPHRRLARMASNDSGDSTPRLPVNEALNELSPEVTSKLRRALGMVSNHQGPQSPSTPAAGREAARLPFLASGAQPKPADLQQQEPEPKLAAVPARCGLITSAKQPAGPTTNAGRRRSSHDHWHLRDMFHLPRDLTRKKGQRSSAAARATKTSAPCGASQTLAPQQ